MKNSDTPSPSKYPTARGWADYLHSAVKAAAAIRLGPAAAELVDLIAPPLERARTEFINDVAERLSRVEQAVDPERLAAFVYGATQTAMATASQEKRTLLANAAVNVALGKGWDQADYFRALIDRFSIEHIRVLRFFGKAHPGNRLKTTQLVEQTARLIVAENRDLAPHKRLVEAIVQELWDLRMLPFPRWTPAALSAEQSDLLTLDASRLSPHGQAFLDFITAPD